MPTARCFGPKCDQIHILEWIRCLLAEYCATQSNNTLSFKELLQLIHQNADDASVYDDHITNAIDNLADTGRIRLDDQEKYVVSNPFFGFNCSLPPAEKKPPQLVCDASILTSSSNEQILNALGLKITEPTMIRNGEVELKFINK